MSKLAIIALITLAPALVRAQTPTTPTTGANTTGTANTGATAPGQSSRPGDAVPTTPTTGANTTGTASTGATVPAPSPSGAGTSAGRVHMDGSDAFTSDRLPNTAAGWLSMLLSGSLLTGAGLTLRRVRK